MEELENSSLPKAKLPSHQLPLAGPTRPIQDTRSHLQSSSPAERGVMEQRACASQPCHTENSHPLCPMGANPLQPYVRQPSCKCTEAQDKCKKNLHHPTCKLDGCRATACHSSLVQFPTTQKSRRNQTWFCSAYISFMKDKEGEPHTEKDARSWCLEVPCSIAI